MNLVLGVVLRIYRAPASDYSGRVADVLTLDRQILRKVLVPDIGGGGPWQSGFMALAQCQESERKAIMAALERGENPDVYRASGAFVLVAEVQRTAQYVIVQVLRHPMAPRDTIPEPEESVPQVTSVPPTLPLDAVPEQVPEPPADADRDLYTAFYTSGYSDGVSRRFAGEPEPSERDLEDLCSLAQDQRWDGTTQTLTVYGRAWSQGVKDGYGATLPPPPETTAPVDGYEREDSASTDTEGGTERAAPQEPDTHYLEVQGVRVRVDRSGVLIDARDSQGVVRVQGALKIIVGETVVTIENGQVVVQCDRVDLGAEGGKKVLTEDATCWYTGGTHRATQDRVRAK